MTDRNEIRRQLGNMPTGPYRLSEQEFSVRRVEPEKPKDSGVFEWNGIWGTGKCDPIYSVDFGSSGADYTVLFAMRIAEARKCQSRILGEVSKMLAVFTTGFYAELGGKQLTAEDVFLHPEEKQIDVMAEVRRMCE